AARENNSGLTDTDDDTAVAAWREQFYELLSNDDYLYNEADDPSHTVSEFDLDFAAVGTIVVMRLFLDGPAEQEELQEIVNESATLHLDSSAATEEWASFVDDYGDPARHLTDELLALSAVARDDDTVRLTDLAMAAIRERIESCDVSVPLLSPAAGMSATELISAIETVDEP